MENNIGFKIRSLREAKNLTLSQLAKELKILPSTLSNWENELRTPKPNSIEMLCDYFNVDLNYFYGFTPTKYNFIDENNSIQIPLFKNAALKNGKINYDKIIQYIVIPKFMLKPNNSYFAVIVKDSSMLGAGLKENDIAVFENGQIAQINQIGAFITKNGIMIRKLQIENSEYYLTPLNELYDRTLCKRIPKSIGSLALIISNRQW